MAERERVWTFFSNHAHVLVALAGQPDILMRDLAAVVGITERAASSIISDLEAEGYLTRIREGRSNRYKLHPARPLRHPLEQHRKIGDVLDLVTSAKPTAGRAAT
jgi:DNA-binding transcriptional ArsR family regulator